MLNKLGSTNIKTTTEPGLGKRHKNKNKNKNKNKKESEIGSNSYSINSTHDLGFSIKLSTVKNCPTATALFKFMTNLL